MGTICKTGDRRPSAGRTPPSAIRAASSPAATPATIPANGAAQEPVIAPAPLPAAPAEDIKPAGKGG